MQPTSRTSGTAEGETSESKADAQKQLVAEVKAQWKLLWTDRFDDKIKAEGVSVSDYDRLRVERGDIIHATRTFKALNFKDILQQNMVENPDRYVQPDTHVGGWNKFIKTQITNGSRNQRHRRAADYVPEKRDPKQQPKKGGRGWLHTP